MQSGMFDWDDGDRFSFEDSDRFEEDSLCSWISEPESLCNNWRGWKKPNGTGNHTGHSPHGRTKACIQEDHPYFPLQDIQEPSGKIGDSCQFGSKKLLKEGQVTSLVELAAREVACNIPFEVVEKIFPPVPEQLQLRIAFWSFAENEEDIRLYSCLANGSADEFQRGEHLFKNKCVADLLQIGFHLSAKVHPLPSGTLPKGSVFNVAVTFDRRRVTSCNCTCDSPASWCSHVVAVCLHRIHQPHQVCLRAPVSESLSRLHREQLQKFAQYLISELPQQILPTAQRLLDELLSSEHTSINALNGAPDPTAGASAYEQTTWCLDESTLHENIRKILLKLCAPSPIVFSDVNYLSSTAPPAAAEWSSLLRPLRGREPEGMWNLLSIVREMFRRSDRNAIPLLEIVTEEVLACDQILLWWFTTRVSLHAGGVHHSNRNNIHSNAHASQHACGSLCDEMVVLWRLAALNPILSPQEKQAFYNKLHDWHRRTLESVWKIRTGNTSGGSNHGMRQSDVDVFPGFKPAMEACLLDWRDYPIPGITYSESGSKRWFSPYLHTHSSLDHAASLSGGESDGSCSYSQRRGRSVKVGQERRTLRVAPVGGHLHNSICDKPTKNESNRSSLSSEGFCENENETFDVLEGCSKELEHNQCAETSTCETGVHKAAGAAKQDIHSRHCLQQQHRNINFFSMPSSSSSFPFLVSKCEDRKCLPHFSGSGGRLVSISGTGSNSSSEDDVPDRNFVASPNQAATENAGDSRANQTSSLPVTCPTSKGNTMLRALETQRLLGVRHPEPCQQPSSKDEYQLYYFEPQPHPPASSQQGSQSESNSMDLHFSVSVKKIEDPLEILFARAEALHAHGHTLEACRLAVQLAEELLANPPNLMIEPPAPPVKGKRTKRFNPASHQIGLLASATMGKAAFLCSVLGENPEHHHLAFRVGLFGLEMARPPASTKALEVKLANQEQDMVVLLKRIPLTAEELQIVRERAERLRDGQLRSRGDALLPLMLASFIFDALTLSGGCYRSCSQAVGRLPTDETLGFEAAVAALGLKANVSEAEHPLLCEGTRRQRGDLAINLLVHYKDDQEKLAKIMDKLLDKEVHQMHKSNAATSYYSNATNSQSGDVATGTTETNTSPSASNEFPVECVTSNEVLPCSSKEAQSSPSGAAEPSEVVDTDAGSTSFPVSSSTHSSETSQQVRERRAAQRNASQGNHSEGTSSPCWEEDYKAWEAKFRCTNLKSNKKHSAGMASIDSSAPETTSSDNSPTVVRRSIWVKQGGPGSDSGSSGESSDSFASSSSGDRAARTRQRDTESPTNTPNILAARYVAPCPPVEAATPRCVPPPPPPAVKSTRFKGKRGYPSIPNQPSEASAHFMFELAKTVLTKAGGNSSTAVLFTQPSTSQNHRGPHRALHICAFQIGLYALGLHNAVSANWLSRTYSSHVSWITGQAMEIGSAAISFLIDTWEGHLTPTEVATLADRASRGRDPSMVQMAAELALSCLPHAHALNPNEIQRALIQCKEQSSEMLERACLAVESAAKGGGVYPEVLFKVAHRWFELYEESIHADRGRGSGQQSRSSEDDSPANIMDALVATQASSAADHTPQADRPVNTVEGVLASATTVQVLPQITCTPVTYALPHAPYTYGYIQRVHPFGHTAIPIHPAYLPPPPSYAYPALNPPYYPSPTTTAPHLCPANPCIYTGQVLGVPVSQATVTQGGRQVLPVTTQAVAVSHSGTLSTQSQPPQVQGQISQLNQRQLGYLLSAYRVGMLAMETLARRVHDDRPQAKYARNPQHGDDVKWLLNVAKRLGTSYLQEFCICAVNSVASPFVLHEIIIDTAHFLARASNPPLSQPLRSHLLTPLIQKCQQMFTACTHFKMYHITPADYDEFVSIIRSARAAYQLSQGGMVQFNELLQSLRRSKSCKKELWQRIATSLASGGI